jgi:hypothetical protein
MRNLATIQTIAALEPIPGKDRILYASFVNVGFKVIVSSDLRVGDKVIYCEADSLLPVKPEFEFLRGRCFNEKWNGFRIRNMKMAGLYSEGIVFDLCLLPDTLYANLKPDGFDVTEILGVTKYDPEAREEASASAGAKSDRKWFMWMYSYWLTRTVLVWLLKVFTPKDKYSWPTWAAKSDETRAQNLPHIFHAYEGGQWVATEKLDGQSCLYGVVKKRFYVCSRNINLKKGATKNNYWDFAIAKNVEKRLQQMRKELGYDFYLQGELCGPGIQGNKYKFTEKRYFVYNIRRTSDGQYWSHDEIQSICFKYGFEYVPEVWRGIYQFKTMKELLAFADGHSVFDKTVLREGVVLRPVIPEPPDRGQSNMKSFKVISPSFDLKWN